MAGGRPGCKRLRLQAAGQEAGPKPAQARQGAVTVCLGDSAEVRLLLGGREAEEEEEEGSAAEARGMEEAWKGCTREKCQGGEEGAEEGGGGSASQHSDHGVPTTPL